MFSRSAGFCWQRSLLLSCVRIWFLPICIGGGMFPCAVNLFIFAGIQHVYFTDQSQFNGKLREPWWSLKYTHRNVQSRHILRAEHVSSDTRKQNKNKTHYVLLSSFETMRCVVLLCYVIKKSLTFDKTFWMKWNDYNLKTTTRGPNVNNVNRQNVNKLLKLRWIF